MEYFVKIKSHFGQLKIFLQESTPKAKYIALATRCGFLATFAALFLASGWYFVFEAQTPAEHSESLAFACAGLLLIAWYSALIFQSKKYAIILEELNSIVGKSMLILPEK